MINSRKIEDLTPKSQLKYHEFEACCNERNICWIVTSTYRDKEYQDYLYEQGRTRPGKVVTWTRNSRHLTGRAWDIAIIKPGIPTKPIWDAKVDVDQDGIPDYEEAAQVGRDLGLIVGADFKNNEGKARPDWPHFEVKEEEV
jgi:peptidoglycan L-alanyl-D-glutamate endopeptidase CwlK